MSLILCAYNCIHVFVCIYCLPKVTCSSNVDAIVLLSICGMLYDIWRWHFTCITATWCVIIDYCGCLILLELCCYILCRHSWVNWIECISLRLSASRESITTLMELHHTVTDINPSTESSNVYSMRYRFDVYWNAQKTCYNGTIYSRNAWKCVEKLHATQQKRALLIHSDCDSIIFLSCSILIVWMWWWYWLWRSGNESFRYKTYITSGRKHKGWVRCCSIPIFSGFLDLCHASAAPAPSSGGEGEMRTCFMYSECNLLKALCLLDISKDLFVWCKGHKGKQRE